MEWAPDQIDNERPLLQAMANLKWNEYQQFAPGTRFLESLVKWLQQFDSIDDRRIAYDLVRKHLIFISSEQIAHLVDILFSEKINPVLIRKTASEINTSPYYIAKILNTESYANNLRTSLFISLSDGSKIDQLRRGAYLDNEQVLTTYQPDDSKVKEMLEKLQVGIPNAKFKTIFLIDDFTASGRSYVRADGGGKLGRIFEKVFLQGNLKGIVELAHIEMHILFYIATSEALHNIRHGIQEWKNAHSVDAQITVDCLLPIDSTIKDKVLLDPDVMRFLSKYFDETIVDEHYKKGKHEQPFLGFNECGLPLVLNHNTPNNSLAILWLPSDKRYKGLFPRISRHREK
jgi:hypothetical protein